MHSAVLLGPGSGSQSTPADGCAGERTGESEAENGESHVVSDGFNGSLHEGSSLQVGGRAVEDVFLGDEGDTDRGGYSDGDWQLQGGVGSEELPPVAGFDVAADNGPARGDAAVRGVLDVDLDDAGSEGQLEGDFIGGTDTYSDTAMGVVVLSEDGRGGLPGEGDGMSHARARDQDGTSLPGAVAGYEG